MRAPALAVAALAPLACTVGGGEGFVVGSLTVPGCEGDEGLDAPDFDLRVDFYAGDPWDDPEADPEQARDSLTLRLQHSGNNTEMVDGLTIQLVDLDPIEVGRPYEVSACAEHTACPEPPLVRATLSLLLTCPDSFEGFVGRGTAPCPETVDAALCEGAFGDRSPYRQILETALPAESACIVFCRLGGSFGDEVAAAFRMRLEDMRSGRSPGWILGRFRFELRRGRAGQAFP